MSDVSKRHSSSQSAQTKKSAKLDAVSSVGKSVPAVPLRFVTAASLFDGHDASINIMRRILQSLGVEVIHLAHNRSVAEVVQAAVQEDVQGIALSSYQGGHVEYFKYVIDMLKEHDASHIKVFGGGGGVIVPAEIKELHDYGVERIYSPQDGMELGLVGMIEDMVKRCDLSRPDESQAWTKPVDPESYQQLSQLITAIERGYRRAELFQSWVSRVLAERVKARSQTKLFGVFAQIVKIKPRLQYWPLTPLDAKRVVPY